MMVEVALFLGLLLLLWNIFRKPPRLPPGRWGLPLFGYIPLFSSKTIEDHVMDLKRQYGDIALWRMGTQVMVFLHDVRLVKEAFTRPEFMNRPDWELFKVLEDPAVGIASSNGMQWHNNRRFALRQLRDLGMGKSKLVEAVQQQALYVRECFARQAGRTMTMPVDLNVAVVNVIWNMTASRRFTPTDTRVKEFVNMMTLFLVNSKRFAFKDFLPWLKYLMPTFLFKHLINYYTMVDIKEKFFEYFNEEIKQHRATLDPANPRDVIDGYMLEQEARKDDPESTFCDRDLAFLLFDLFFAGSETTATTIHWACGYLANNPHIQAKVHAEIDEVLPKGVLATLEEKTRMPYTEALINEVLRHSSLVNFSLQRMATTDAELGGYFIPKGTILNCASFAIHGDDRYWERPQEFWPERWLDSNGKINMKKEGFVPFGVGKRVCPGESLARMELFIFITTIFQSFSVAPPPGKTINTAADLGSLFIRKPAFQEFLFTARE